MVDLSIVKSYDCKRLPEGNLEIELIHPWISTAPLLNATRQEHVFKQLGIRLAIVSTASLFPLFFICFPHFTSSFLFDPFYAQKGLSFSLPISDPQEVAACP